jgi:hypothetical protein
MNTEQKLREAIDWLIAEINRDSPAVLNAKKALAAEPVQWDLVAWKDRVMEKAQEFACAWSLVGGRFDDGTALAHAEQIKSELRAMVSTQPRPAQETLQVDTVYRWNALDYSGYCYGSNPPDNLPERANLTAFHKQQPAPLAYLTDKEIEVLRQKTFSPDNPFFCPCGSKTMRIAANAIMDAMIQKNGGGE